MWKINFEARRNNKLVWHDVVDVITYSRIHFSISNDVNNEICLFIFRFICSTNKFDISLIFVYLLFICHRLRANRCHFERIKICIICVSLVFICIGITNLDALLICIEISCLSFFSWSDHEVRTHRTLWKSEHYLRQSNHRITSLFHLMKT